MQSELKKKISCFSPIKKPDLKKSNLQSGDFLHVYCRLRPIPETEEESPLFQISEDQKCLEILDEKNHQTVQQKFEFKHVFSKTDNQTVVYKTAVLRVIKSLFENGENGLIFTYGVSNSGKTHTIIGNDENPGILRNVICHILQIREKLLNEKPLFSQFVKSQIWGELAISKSKLFFNHQLLFYNSAKTDALLEIKVRLVCFEIYENKYVNLCSGKREMYEHLKDIDLIEGLLLKDPVLAVKQMGGILKNRTVTKTNLNDVSSRSHSVFKLILEFCFNDPKLNQTRFLNIIDLAGSERVERANGSISESTNINKTLFNLRTTFKNVNQNQLFTTNGDKLLKYLAEYFRDKKSYIVLIININPRKDDFRESKNALEFGVDAVRLKPIAGKVENLRGSVSYLRTDVKWDNTELFSEKEFKINSLLAEKQDLEMLLVELKQKMESERNVLERKIQELSVRKIKSKDFQKVLSFTCAKKSANKIRLLIFPEISHPILIFSAFKKEESKKEEFKKNESKKEEPKKMELSKKPGKGANLGLARKPVSKTAHKIIEDVEIENVDLSDLDTYETIESTEGLFAIRRSRTEEKKRVFFSGFRNAKNK